MFTAGWRCEESVAHFTATVFYFSCSAKFCQAALYKKLSLLNLLLLLWTGTARAQNIPRPAGWWDGRNFMLTQALVRTDLKGL